MTWEHVAMAIVVGAPLACFLAYLAFIWRKRHPKAPKPTPYADSTKVAQQLREREERH